MSKIDDHIRNERNWFEEHRKHIPERICALVDTLLYWRDLDGRVIVDMTQENQRLLTKLYGNPDALHDRQPREVNVQHGKHTQTEEA